VGTKPRSPRGLTFEKALQRLEEIVSELEDPQKGLEQALVLFEEGVTLSRFCRGKIDEIQKRVEVVLKETPQGFVTGPFEGEDDTEDGEEGEGGEDGGNGEGGDAKA
jgi:exodeoxyribonuclease VII small subunit